MRNLYKVLAGVALAAVCAPTIAQRGTQKASAPDADAWEQKVIELTNAERAKTNLPPLKRQANLGAAARWLAADMGAKSYFDHQDRQGRRIDRRLPDFGYKNFRAIGENIAAGQRSPADVVKGWMDSPAHRANILGDKFSEIGAGYAPARDRLRHYWVQDFGTHFDRFPLVINGEAARARGAKVSLFAYGAGWARQMRLSNDGRTWTNWERFEAERTWALAPGRGMRTVYVELRNAPGQVRRAQDSIELSE